LLQWFKHLAVGAGVGGGRDSTWFREFCRARIRGAQRSWRCRC